MQHLNYCRQIAQQAISSRAIPREKAMDIFTRLPHSWPVSIYYSAVPENLDDLLADAKESVKFMLPKNGRILDDGCQYRALQNNKSFRLPFSKMVFEFEANNNTKVAVFIAETDKDDVHCRLFVCNQDGLWRICSGSWIDTSSSMILVDGKYTLPVLKSQHIIDAEEQHGEDLTMFIAGPVATLLDFLNALACKNVHIEKSPAKSTKHGKKVKTALPFDDYHFLSVDVPGKSGVRGEGFGGSHRSPREHLRRGHIRRLDSGPIWVNACVVNAGIGSKVGKSYLVRKSA